MWTIIFILPFFLHCQIAAYNINSTISSSSHANLYSNNPIPVQGHFYNGTVTSGIVFPLLFKFTANADQDVRVFVQVHPPVSRKDKVSFLVRQQSASFSWDLPRTSMYDGTTYLKASRTLCNYHLTKFDSSGNAIVENEFEPTEPNYILVIVSTLSPESVQFSVSINVTSTLYIKEGSPKEMDIEPDVPGLMVYRFPSDKILLKITSNDSLCVTVSVQDAQCPTFDQEENVILRGFWQTMNNQSGFMLQKSEFPSGVRVVFVMHGNEAICEKLDNATRSRSLIFSGGYIPSHSLKSSRDNRVKHVLVEALSVISRRQMYWAMFTPLAILMVISCISIFISLNERNFILCFSWCRCSFQSSRLNLFRDRKDTGTEDATSPSTSRTEIDQNDGTSPVPGSSHSHSPENSKSAATTISFEETEEIGVAKEKEWSKTTGNSDANTEQAEAENDRTPLFKNTDASASSRRLPRYRYPSDICAAQPHDIATRSNRYLTTISSCSLFYIIPVFQMVVDHQKRLFQTGNMDLCYYNFLCAHPLWMLSDFNHVFSNVGYIVLGVTFLVIVHLRERAHKQLLEIDPNAKRKGIPNHFGFFYAMGFALVMEGILSACYHVCPNQSNFQFDTLFMYINAALCTFKLYQARHPDINVEAYVLFTSLPVLETLVPIFNYSGNAIAFYAVVTTLHISLFILALYYFQVRLDPLVYESHQDLPRLFLILVSSGVNLGLAIYGMIVRPADFATHLLIVFGTNFALYFAFYVIMKIFSKDERICWKARLSFLLGSLLLGVSAKYFFHSETSWQGTPADSRNFNEECVLFGFYDTHDIWHFLSSLGVFFLYMTLLTLDDDRAETEGFLVF